MTLPTSILWTDLETTGLSPDKDKVLELCIISAPFADPFNITAPNHATVEKVFPLKDWSQVPPEVVQMHATYDGSGSCLMLECMLAKGGSKEYTAWQEADRQLVQAFAPEGGCKTPEDRLVLAGSSVHFDLEFIKVHFPSFATQLSHRVYDVSALKLFCYSMGMPEIPKGAPAHRARADILSSIEHAKLCEMWLTHRLRET